MTPVCVLDGSVAVAWILRDEASDRVDRLLDDVAREGGVVPALWALEVANALVVAERRGRLAPADTARAVSLAGALPVRVVADPPARTLGEALALARAQALSVYDASYLDLAMREGLPLATLDDRLREAAARCGVPVLPA